MNMVPHLLNGEINYGYCLKMNCHSLKWDHKNVYCTIWSEMAILK